jgi:hypothetical protein
MLGLKQPSLDERIRERVSTNIDLIDEQQSLNQMLASDYNNLTWNNYFEDIGEGRQYKGMWIKPNEWNLIDTQSDEDANDKISETDQNKSKPKIKSSFRLKSKTRWCGIGIIKFEDGSLYEGQTTDGLFNGMGRMTHANDDIYQGQW